jgi:WD40 repeat protein
LADLRSVTEESPPAPLEIPHPDFISALAFSPDSRLLATGSVDGTTRVVRVVDGRVLALIDNGPGVRGKIVEPGSTVQNLKFSPNGRFLGISGEFPRAQLIPLVAGLGEEAFLSHEYPVRAVAFSADSRLFASGGDDSTARIAALDDADN